MSGARRTHAGPSPSADASPSSDSSPSRGRRGMRHANDSSDSKSESDEGQAATRYTFQSTMAAEIPNNILAALNSMRRNMELNFRTLQEAIQTQHSESDKRFEQQRVGTDKRFQEQRAETDKRFQEQRAETDKKFHEQRLYTKELIQLLRTHSNQYNANRGATHIHSSIYPVGRFHEAMGEITVPQGFPKRVHQFLRLKIRSNWSVLVNLLRFYDIQSWPTWGVYSMWPDDESDTEELLAPKHRTLADAVEFAPEIALQELAAVIGLDYDKITINREEDERLQDERILHRKRGLSEDSEPVKPEKSSRVRASEQTIAQLVRSPKAKPQSLSSGEVVGWDIRNSEDRTPPEQKPRVQDIVSHRQRNPRSPDVQISNRKDS